MATKTCGSCSYSREVKNCLGGVVHCPFDPEVETLHYRWSPCNREDISLDSERGSPPAAPPKKSTPKKTASVPQCATCKHGQGLGCALGTKKSDECLGVDFLYWDFEYNFWEPEED